MKKYYNILLLLLLSVSHTACGGNGGKSPDTPGKEDDPRDKKDYFYITGSRKDIQTSSSGGVLMAGGGTDHDGAMKWMLTNANGGDIVIIRHSGSDGYNLYLFAELGVKVNSVISILIDNKTKANDEDVYNTIVNAEALFIAGGDQSKYISTWGGTKVEDAIKKLVEKGSVTIGGTSAGMAVLSQFCYTGANGSSVSDEVLANPFHNTVTITESIIEIPALKGVITDTHFSQRNRLGRLVVFMARLYSQDGDPIYGVGADEKSALAVDHNGKAIVFGSSITLLRTNNEQPERMRSGEPLTWDAKGKALYYGKLSGSSEGVEYGLFSDLISGKTDLQWSYRYVLNGELK